MPVHEAHAPPTDAPRLPGNMETVAYRVVQEALTNVVRHAHASSARVSATRQHGLLDAHHGREHVR